MLGKYRTTGSGSSTSTSGSTRMRIEYNDPSLRAIVAVVPATDARTRPSPTGSPPSSDDKPLEL